MKRKKSGSTCTCSGVTARIMRRSYTMRNRSHASPFRPRLENPHAARRFPWTSKSERLPENASNSCSILKVRKSRRVICFRKAAKACVSRRHILRLPTRDQVRLTLPEVCPQKKNRLVWRIMATPGVSTLNCFRNTRQVNSRHLNLGYFMPHWPALHVDSYGCWVCHLLSFLNSIQVKLDRIVLQSTHQQGVVISHEKTMHVCSFIHPGNAHFNI